MEYTWLIVMVACIVIEAFTMGLTTIWFAAGALIVALLSLTGIGLTAQIIIFLLISILLLIFTRPVAVKHLKIGKEKTNFDTLIGEQAVVTTSINNLNNVGNVKIKGLIWSAESMDGSQIAVDEVVYVKKIQGVKLIVSKTL